MSAETSSGYVLLSDLRPVPPSGLLLCLAILPFDYNCTNGVMTKSGPGVTYLIDSLIILKQMNCFNSELVLRRPLVLPT